MTSIGHTKELHPMQAFGGCKKSRFYRRKSFAEGNSSRAFFTISGVGKEGGNEIHLVSNTICLKFLIFHDFSRPFLGLFAVISL